MQLLIARSVDKAEEAAPGAMIMAAVSSGAARKAATFLGCAWATVDTRASGCARMVGRVEKAMFFCS